MFRSRVVGNVRLFGGFSRLNRPLQHMRGIKISASTVSRLSKYGTIVNVLAGAYIGGLIVSLGSFYLIYHDANERQRIPFELSFQDQIDTVQAINKDDVLQKPTYAVKHYRKVLINLAKASDANLDESKYPGYEIPLIDPEVLIYQKSNKFANFYIDLILRYSKALLVKGEVQASLDTLSKVIDNDLIYYKLGDAERLSECSRLLAFVYSDPQDRIALLKKSIDMLKQTYSSIRLNDDYTLVKGSKISDELLACLNDLAFQYAKLSSSSQQTYQSKSESKSKSKSMSISRFEKQKYLEEALAIYLSNLQTLTNIRESLETRTKNQSNYPLFNVDRENLITQICALKAHISEILWSQGYKQNAISWSEEVLKELFYDNAASPQVTSMLENVLNNLIAMYTKIKKPEEVRRCNELKSELKSYARSSTSISTKRFDRWYHDLIKRWSEILYDQGPLGIITKPLQERFGPGVRVRELEEFEKEDEL